MQVSEVCIHHKKPERIAAVYVCVCKLVKCVCITKNPNRIASRLPLYPSMCGNSGEGTATEKARLSCAAVPWPCAQIDAWPAVGVEGVRECCREHLQNVRDDAIALSSRCRALRVCRPMHTQPTLLHRVLLVSRFGRWKFEWEGFKSPGSSKKMIYFCFWRNRLRIFCTVRKFDGGSLY